jgi:hypothetical protein
VERRIPIQKSNSGVVFVNDVVCVIGIASEHFADEAASSEFCAYCVEINSLCPPSHNEILGRFCCARAIECVGWASVQECPLTVLPCTELENRQNA